MCQERFPRVLRLSGARLHGYAWHARRDARENLPGNRGGGFGVVESRYGLVAGFAGLRAENYNLVAVFDAGNFGHVENNLIHADAADDGRALAANQETEPIAKRASEAVSVTGGDERKAHRLGGNEGSVVTDSRA